MLTIFIFSSDNGVESSRKSDGIIIKISEMLVGHSVNSDEREKYIEKYSFYIRKFAHFSIYFLLGFLLVNLIYEYKTINYKCLLFALLISFIYACSDEVHQLFVVGRSGNIIDVLIDTFGASIGISFYYLIYKWRKKYE